MRHENVLFVGIGGGNDIFSTVLAMSALRHLGWTWQRCAIAGVLSPFHDHDVIATGARCLRVTHGASRRFIPTKDGAPVRRIGFIDASVSRMADETLASCEAVYGLDLRGGSDKLVTTFKRLAHRYDMIVLVDVGGDCFYHGASDPHVLSPMFDAITLRAFVDAKVPGLLLEAGPGSDGELEPEALRQSLFDVGAEPHDLPATAIDKYETLYRKYIEHSRPGNTVRNTIKAFRSTERELTVWIRLKQVCGRTTFVRYLGQRISPELCRRFYLIDPCKVRNPFMLRCADAKEWFVKTQIRQGFTHNEANMQSLRVGEEIWCFATPSPLLAPRWRRYILEDAIADLRSGQGHDGLWMRYEDWMTLPLGIGLEGLRMYMQHGLVHLVRF